MTELQTGWYVLKTETGHCQIVQAQQTPTTELTPNMQKWGPFASQGDAIARRVGLIRAGKCAPA